MTNVLRVLIPQVGGTNLLFWWRTLITLRVGLAGPTSPTILARGAAAESIHFHPLLCREDIALTLERALEPLHDPQADATRNYCLAVRSALTDDGRAPLQALGLKLQERLTSISDSLARVEQKKSFPPH